MLSVAWGAEAGIEGITDEYGFQFNGNLSSETEYEIRIDAGDENPEISLQNLIANEENGVFSVLGEYEKAYADDGEYTMSAQLIEDGNVLETLTFETSIANSAPILHVATSRTSAEQGEAYEVEFVAHDLGDDSILQMGN